mmetsp:Transcript_13855/g.39910  ORF Transcript_13855/g.39910 Transcript_13855/m.39910 type:complete len:214 (-) Transcript_13855:239-880(-)
MPVRGRTQRASAVTTIKEDSALDGKIDTGKQKGVMKSVSFNDNANIASAGRPAKSKIESQKRVHWNHKVEKKRHYRVQDLSPEEREAVWYTEGDTKIILAMAKVTVKMMMKGEPCDDIDYCSRGLEGKTPTGSKKRQKNKLRVRKSLLEEQEIQREEGVLDPDYLAQVSIKYSKDVVAEAHNVALRDERNIQEYLSFSDGDFSPMQPRRMKRS